MQKKLIPLKLLYPVQEGIHEWSPQFRDLLFDLAEFRGRKASFDPAHTARLFRLERRSELLNHFSDGEVALLLVKAHEFELVRQDGSSGRAGS